MNHAGIMERGREGGEVGGGAGGGRRWEEGRRERDSHESWSRCMGNVSLCYSIDGSFCVRVRVRV